MTGRLTDLDDPDYPAYTTGRAAEVLGVQQAFLRSLDAAGAVKPERSAGGRRRYTRRQLAFAVRIRELFDQGHTLTAALRILALEDDLAAEQAQNARLQARLRARPGGRSRTPPDRTGGVLLAGAAAGTRPGCPGRCRLAEARQRLQPGQLGLQPAGFLLQFQDPADAGEIQPVGAQRADLVEPVDVPAGIPAGAARAAGRIYQALPLVNAQRLGVQPGQLRGH
jgi:MerR family transcriptional regulator/heat shock protein HspR